MKNVIQNSSATADPPEIRVHIEKGTAIESRYRFARTFRIGRAEECDIRFLEEDVSRVHAEVRFHAGAWRISDLGSSNGVWINGRKIKEAPLKKTVTVELSPGGTALSFAVPEKNAERKRLFFFRKSADEDAALKEYAAHYFGDARGENIGEHTMMVRRAYQRVKKKEKRFYFGIIAVCICLFLAAGGYAVHKHREFQKQKALAEDIFYAMKSLELEFADVLRDARTSRDKKLEKTVQVYRARRREMESSYERFIRNLNVYKNAADEKERLIMKEARIFGECEVDIPEGFKAEVLKYIEKWKSTPRLAGAVQRARQNGYARKIREVMEEYDLPPQFFYLALQESGFDVDACGPRTRYGIAKGAWQFIPATARDYGLRIGPLADQPVPDPEDDRHQFDKATAAAARHLRKLYDTEAQASGLLVMASYNWGERRVIDMIRKMPENPRERNFWRLLKENRDRIPKETYDYVFYIFSAAVIGENPALFGFDFKNPLKDESTGIVTMF